jgi:hydroxyethylthiazole kinase-like uncharacterized protein yjeF
MVSRTPEPREPAQPGEPERAVYILTREAVREVDRLAAAEFGIPSIVLMENAAFHIADLALHLVEEKPSPRILIVCGPGNNGGDGLAAARHLHNAGAVVEIVLAAPEAALAGDAATNLQICRRMGLPMQVEDTLNPGRALQEAAIRLGQPDLIIDAILGTGLRDRVRDPLAGVIAALNRTAKDLAVTVLAVDIPSGLECDSGEALGIAVQADVTISMVGLKAGFTKLAAQSIIGDVVVVDIGAPRELTERLGTPLKDQELPERFMHPEHRAAPQEADERDAARRLGDS